MKPRIVIGLTIIIAAVVFLLFGSLKKASVYYLTVSELKAQAQQNEVRGIRVSGMVVPESIDWDAEKLELSFALQDGIDTMQVWYNDLLPDQLADNQQVVVEGHWRKEHADFLAEKILFKCPSKYEIKQAPPAENKMTAD